MTRVRKPKRYLHAIEQREFLDDVISAGGLGFFASSVEEVIERLRENNIMGINILYRDEFLSYYLIRNYYENY